MVSAKVPKPATVSKADVASNKHTLSKLQRQLTASNRRNNRLYKKLSASQDTATAQQAEQISLLQAAALKSAETSPDTTSYDAAIQATASLYSQATSDRVTSQAYADAQKTSQQDAYTRRTLVNKLIRNGQL